jgi:polyketide cyclase/dehydrase/lipid transport protein
MTTNLHTNHPPHTKKDNRMTKTLYTHVDVEIARPPATVWNVVTDYATDTVWRKGITEMTPDRDGPPRVGTNVREVLQLGGRKYVTDTSVTEVGPGMSYSFAGLGTSGVVRGRRSVVTAGTPDATVFSYDVEIEPNTIPRLARPILRWWLQHSLRRDVSRLRTMLEQTP